MQLLAMSMPRLRPALVLVHRWVGLVMAGFLLVAGLTGALMAWTDELEAWLCPGLHLAPPPAADARPMDMLALHAQLQAAHPHLLLSHVPLMVAPGRALVWRVSARPDPATGATPAQADNQMFVNPYTGQVQGSRHWGDLSQGMKNLLPFIYRLHYQLALGVVGSYVFGVIALLWTLDCFAGAYLTFPVAARKAPPPGKPPGKPWLARWWPAWRVRWGGGSYKLHFDLHRAGGLWLWAMLFVLAWSSVAFNLSEVYEPVMKTVFTHQASDAALPPLASPQPAPALGWQAALAQGRQRMAEQALAKGFVVQREYSLMHDPGLGAYYYSVISDRDVSHRWGSTYLVLDADTGALRHLMLPTGEASGDTIRTWLIGLHMASIGTAVGMLAGGPMQLFLCALGVAVAMLSYTGVVIWWRKRGARAKQ